MNIASLCDSVLPNCSGRFDCPDCGGFQSLSISKRDGSAFYKCFKASCNLHGKLSAPMSHDEVVKMISAKTGLIARTEAKQLFRIPEYWIQGIASKRCFQMLTDHNAVEAYMQGLFKTAYDPRQDRLVYLIQDYKGAVHGAVGRTLCGAKPKTFNYGEDYRIPFTCGFSEVAVLVEDCASACSIARIADFTGVALLGTDIRDDYLVYLAKNFKRVIVAVDRDATHKAIKLRQRLKVYFNQVSIWRMFRDFKSMKRTEVLEFVKSQETKFLL